MSPKSNDYCPCKRKTGRSETQRHLWKQVMKIEAGTEATHLQAQDCPHPPEARRKAQNGVSSGPSKGTNPVDTLNLHF